MHEFNLMDAVMKQVLGISAGHGRRRVVRVTLGIGALTQVVPESLEMAFKVLSSGTDAETAELYCTPVEALVECEACSHIFQPDALFWQCPRCQGRACRVLNGNDVLLESVELDDEVEAEGKRNED